MTVRKNSIDTRKLTYLAMMTALVVVLQFAGSFIRFGTFSVSLVLLPIVVGAAICGPFAGAWLGFIFGIVVLASGDASVFLAIDPFGTVVTVIVKGTVAGLLSGLLYSLVEKWNKYVAVFVASVVCPLVNTGIFLLGSLVFFMDTITEWAAGAGSASVGAYMILVLVGGNFIFELIFNLILAPAAVTLINYVPKFRSKKNTK